jgi:hypothetical protein
MLSDDFFAGWLVAWINAVLHAIVPSVLRLSSLSYSKCYPVPRLMNAPTGLSQIRAWLKVFMVL